MQTHQKPSLEFSGFLSAGETVATRVVTTVRASASLSSSEEEAGAPSSNSAPAVAAVPSLNPPPPARAAPPAVAAPAAAEASAAPAASKTAATPAKPAPPKPWLKPGPKGKSYLPLFAAPEAYGKKKDPKYDKARKDAAELPAKIAAKKQRQKERERERRRKKKAGETDGSSGVQTEETEAWKLALIVAFGLFTALAEALDLDVLLGILFMPVMSVMKYLAAEFDNVNLDPSTWSTKIGNAYNDLCQNHPAGFVGTDFGFFLVFVNLILFEADISKWWRERNLRAQGYEDLDEAGESGPSDETLERIFREIDANGSGDISREEMEG